MTNATLRDELNSLLATAKAHRCSEATVVYDAYCGCESLHEEIAHLQINLDHPHGRGLAADSYLREYLFDYDLSRYTWERAVADAANGGDEPPF